MSSNQKKGKKKKGDHKYPGGGKPTVQLTESESTSRQAFLPTTPSSSNKNKLASLVNRSSHLKERNTAAKLKSRPAKV